MDDNNSMNVNLMDIDLNQEPIDSHPFHDISFESLLLDRAQELVEERIRQLEGVSARERQRQDRNDVEITTIDGIKGGDGSRLVAKALEINPRSKMPVIESRSFYHCNICFEVAIEPILTRCGHLFCWACFYQVPDVDLNLKECPICKGEVTENGVIPIYGNSDNERVDETEWGMKIPPRPTAGRVESFRQRNVARGVPHSSVEAVLRHIMISIEEGAQSFEADPQAASGSRVTVNHVPRVLSESTASLSTLSSALVSAERLVEELETVINSRLSVAANMTARDLTSGFGASSSVNRSTEASGSGARFSARRTARHISMFMNNPDGVRETRMSRRRRLN